MQSGNLKEKWVEYDTRIYAGVDIGGCATTEPYVF